MNYYLTGIITESSIAVGGKIDRRDTGKLSQATEYLNKKRQNVKASNPTVRIELAELSNLIKRRKAANIRKYNIEKTEHALKNGGNLKAAKRK